MRVTKIVREYVEKVVWKKHDEVKAQIPEVLPLRGREEFKIKEEQYAEFANQKFSELLDELAKKREELGIKLVPFNRGYYSSKQTCTYEQEMKEDFNSVRYFDRALEEDHEYVEYQQKIVDLKAEYQDKIDTILIGLEIGDIKKQELEAALEEFKI